MKICRIIEFGISLSILLGCPLARHQIASAQNSPAIPAEWYEDAELTDVCFIDASSGWITGEHGLLLSTKDGGRSWRQVETNLDCRLESVCFIDAEIGYVVGGSYQPHNRRSVGVILKTLDGGKTWVRDRNLTLPRLCKIHFSDTRTGWALGDGSAMYPSGIFYTHDGGRAWSCLNAAQITPWRDGGLGQDHFLLISPDGRLQRMTTNGDLLGDGLPPAEINFNCLDYASDQLLWAAGNAGWIARSVNGGSHWQSSNQEINGMVRELDFATICARGESCWLAGRPGSRVIRTKDAGRSWSAFPTGQSTPLTKLFFLDENHGWAIGALGTVLSTLDGGETWQTQRGGNRRATVLAFFSDSRQVPLEIFSLIAAGDGRYCAVELVESPASRQENRQPSSEAARLRQALARIGCSSVERFVLDNSHSSASTANPTKQQADLTEQRLVALIRSWQPAIVMTDQADAKRPESVENEFNRQLLQAIEGAGNEQAYAYQISHAGLSPWRVAKTISVGEYRNWSDATISSAQYSPHLGRTIEDHAFISQQLLHENFRLPPQKYCLKQQRTDLPDRYSAQGLLSGVAAIIGENSRQPPTPTSGNLQSLRFLTKKQEYLSNLLNVRFSSPASEAHWRSQLMTTVAGLLPETGGNILFQLACQYNAAGRPELAEKTFRLYLNHYNNHELTDSAMIWLLQYHASGEVQYGEWKRIQAAPVREQGLAVQPAADRLPSGETPDEMRSGRLEFDPQVSTADYAAEVAKNDPRNLGPNEQAAAYEPEFLIMQDHASQARAVAAAIKRARPELGEMPQLQWPIAALSRSDPTGTERMQAWQRLKNLSQVDSPWSPLAEAESWLEQREIGESPLPLAHCVEIPAPPKLDGQLDEHFWRTIAQSPQSIQLTSDDADAANKTNTTIMLAHDRRFVYLAAICQKYADVDYPADRRARPRDPDLSAFDRIVFTVDIDRDYVSYYQLSVDQRGWVSESRFEDPSWDPHWFVASSCSDTEWTIEAAISIDDLAQRLPTGAEAWVLGIQRHAPHHQEQRWTKTPQSGLHCGLLMFGQ